MEEENKKYVYLFKEGNAQMKDILGGKGANLAEMTNLGLPIPQGFTISAECCKKYYEDGEKISDNILKQIDVALSKLEDMTGKKLGDIKKPLLVSVRSGARVSMPGMMDTILNLGINDETVKTLAVKNRRFAYDSYRRFIQMYSDVVKGIPNSIYESAIDTKKRQRGLHEDTDMDANDLEDLVKVFKGIYYDQTGTAFPQDVKSLLLECIEAVFKSWNNQRAITYRRLNDIPGDWGTAVNVQMMVFGNMGDDCGTGVAFSRNPATGENKIYGEFLMNAQGEDVVAGIRTPMTIDKLAEIKEGFIVPMNEYGEIVRQHTDIDDIEHTTQSNDEIMSNRDMLYQADYMKYQEFLMNGVDLGDNTLVFISGLSVIPFEKIFEGEQTLKEILEVQNEQLLASIFVRSGDTYKSASITFDKNGVIEISDYQEIDSLDNIIEHIEHSEVIGNAPEYIRILKLQGKDKKAQEIQKKYEYFLKNKDRIDEIRQKFGEKSEEKSEMDMIAELLYNGELDGVTAGEASEKFDDSDLFKVDDRGIAYLTEDSFRETAEDARSIEARKKVLADLKQAQTNEKPQEHKEQGE